MWIDWTATNNSNAAAFLSNLHFCLRLSFCPESDPRLIPGPCVHHGVRAGVGIAALSSARLLSKHFKWQNVASRVKQYFSTKIYTYYDFEENLTIESQGPIPKPTRNKQALQSSCELLRRKIQKYSNL